MKFIDDRNIPGNPISFAGFLKDKGVLAKHNSEWQNAPHSYANRQGVWIIIDSQFEDALSLIENKNHEVSEPLTGKEMERLEEEAKQNFYKSSTKVFSFIGKAVFYIAFTVAVIIMGYKIVSST